MATQTVNLPAGLKLPGVYTQVVLNSDGGVAAPNNRVLIWAYMGTGGAATQNVAFQALNKAQVDALCKPWSMASHAYAAAKSALPEGIGAEFWIVPMLEPSSGSAQTRKIKFLGAPTNGVNGAGTAALAADTCTISYRGRGGSFGIKVGDTWAVIATNAKAMLDAIPDLPCTTAIGTDTLTLTARHKGSFDDGALQVDFANAAGSGCAASPGTLAFTGVAGVGGTCTLTLGVGAASFAVTAADTAVVSAGNAAAAIRSDAYQVDAAVPSPADGSVTLYYQTGRPCRAISAAMAGGVTVQTVAASCDVPGTGTPAAAVANALTKLNSDENAYKAWSVFFTDSTSLSSVVTTVEAQAAVGTLEKTQMVFLVTTGNLATLSAANIPASTTPAMTSSAAYAVGYYQGHPNAGWEVAARVAAVVAAESYTAKNYNGKRLPTNTAVPFGVPHKADRASREDMNTAISFGYFPLAVDSGGYNAIVRSNGTYRAQGYNDRAMEKWSCFLTCGFFRNDLAADLKLAFGDKSIKQFSDPRTTNTVKPLGVKARVYERVDRWDNLDLFDGAASVRDAIMAGVFVSPNRIDLQCPFRTVKDIDQIVVAGIQQ